MNEDKKEEGIVTDAAKMMMPPQYPDYRSNQLGLSLAIKSIEFGLELMRQHSCYGGPFYTCKPEWDGTLDPPPMEMNVGEDDQHTQGAEGQFTGPGGPAPKEVYDHRGVKYTRQD
jgi:hypothetical protein